VKVRENGVRRSLCSELEDGYECCELLKCLRGIAKSPSHPRGSERNCQVSLIESWRTSSDTPWKRVGGSHDARGELMRPAHARYQLEACATSGGRLRA